MLLALPRLGMLTIDRHLWLCHHVTLPAKDWTLMMLVLDMVVRGVAQVMLLAFGVRGCF